MNVTRARHTVPVRAWFALAAIVTFFLVISAVLGSIVLFGAGDDTAQDRIARTGRSVDEGADSWHDPGFRAAASSALADDGVTLVLYEGGVELDQLGAVPEQGAADQVVRRVAVAGTDPPLTAEISTPVDGDDPLPAILRATALIGGIAAAVSLAFGRPFVRSLTAVRRAASRVAEGEMEPELDRSRITELDDLNRAFTAMTSELDRSLAQQAELEQERRLFIAAIAHDLRTPLFSLRGYLDGLRSGVANSPEQRARYLAIASDKAETLDRLVADLFDHTRLENLDPAMHIEPLDLTDLLGRLVESLRPQAVAAGVGLLLHDPGHRCQVQADRDQLARAATNLVENAIQYTPSGGRVTVTCGTDGDGAWFTVTDTGPGIAAADLPHLFLPLYRGHNGSGNAAGSGLGLAIAKRIVEAHGGDLRAANAPSGGATFTTTIPSALPVPPAAAPNPSSAQPGGWS